LSHATWLRNAVLAILLALGTAACSWGGDDTLTVTATFDDVIDLVTAAGVRAGDVPIGTVTDIELTDDERALVTMEIEPGTGLPADVQANLAKTSLLGERYVDLRPTGERGRLEDGQHIEDTRVVRDVEDLVRAGNDALAFVAAEQLAAAVETGARAFGGRGGLIGQFITDVEAVVGRYADDSDDLVRLIDSLDELTGELAPDADANAAALATLQRTAESLDAQDERLLDALDDVRRLSVVGARILDEHEREFDNLVRRLELLTAQVNRIPNTLQLLLTYAPRHNLHVPNGVVNEEAQVWLDFIICGVNDTDGDPSRDCTPPNPGEPSQPPPFQPNPESCNESHTDCPGRRPEQVQDPDDDEPGEDGGGGG
jgi:phospholipid/cholesterol/gamma-HCH transport system substrate-binding protein